MMVNKDKKLIESLFIKYTKINTRSDENSNSIPSTHGQIQLAETILDDLKEIGTKNLSYSKKDGYLVASLPNNSGKDLPSIGFIAHLDTANFPSENVRPQVYKNYDGKDIILNEKKNIILSTKTFPNLKNYIGQTLITTDGQTLLGADDKAGIVACISAINYFITHPKIKHGNMKFTFGPDEEIGKGAKRIDIDRFNVDFAYTLDNGLPGQLEMETFNAAQAKINIVGTSVHPGNAYGTMVNAITIANSIINQLPKNEVPEKSKDYEGFFLVTEFNASVNEGYINIIIRDFDDYNFKKKKKLLKNIVNNINDGLDYPRIKLSLYDQYYNIANYINKNPYIYELIAKVYKKMGLELSIKPFRGGTDGNFFSQKGVPTPNLFNGGENFHGPYEFVTLESIQTVSDTICNIAEENVKYLN